MASLTVPWLQVLSGVPNCLLTGNSVLQALSNQGEIIVDQITSDIYTYDDANKLSMSSGEIDHEAL